MKIKEHVKIENLTDQTFGKLTVQRIKESSKGTITWQCLCACGNIKVVSGDDLRAGRTKSCGCLKREKLTTHGMTGTPEYATWRSMLSRCHNQNNSAYKDYGGRGITVCKEWLHSFEHFFRDTGQKPVGLTLERIDNNLGYFKNNCKWATCVEQNRNQRVRSCNISHVTGVFWRKRSKTWEASIGVDYKSIFLGGFSNLEEAIKARKEGERKYWNNENCKGCNSRIGT